MRTITLIKYLITGIFLICILNCKNAPRQTNFSDEKVVGMLYEFYKCYITERSNWPFNMNRIDSIKRQYCTHKLISYFQKLSKEEKIESDPFLQSQIADSNMLKTLNIRKDPKRDDVYYVSYKWPYNNNELITTKLIVVKEVDHYKIDYVFIEYLKK